MIGAARASFESSELLPCIQYRRFGFRARYIGNEGKYAFTGPGIANNDMSLFKNFNVRGERWKAQLRGEFYNTLNHTQFSAVNTDPKFDKNGVPTNLAFGQYTAARQPRRVQLAIRLTF